MCLKVDFGKPGRSHHVSLFSNCVNQLRCIFLMKRQQSSPSSGRRLSSESRPQWAAVRHTGSDPPDRKCLRITRNVGGLQPNHWLCFSLEYACKCALQVRNLKSQTSSLCAKSVLVHQTSKHTRNAIVYSAPIGTPSHNFQHHKLPLQVPHCVGTLN